MPATPSLKRSVRDETGVARHRPDRRDRPRTPRQRLDAAYEQAATADAATSFSNFGGVDYINSTGIALIVGLLAQARKDRQSLVRACGLADHYREIFEITRLSDFMQIFPDEESAVGELTAERREVAR